MALNKRNKKKAKNEEEKKTDLREKMTELLELPKEVVLNIPKITIVGNRNLIVENYKGIVEYDNTRIRINTGNGIIRITGEKLEIREITSEDILVCGEMSALEFLK